MSRIRHAIAVAALLAACISGCSGSADEGGVVGSGISSIQGNVLQVQIVPDAPDDGGAAAGAAVPSLRVSIEQTGDETSTDADGNFSLDGSFAGMVTVRFTDATSPQGMTLGTVTVDIGAGATVVLPDIEIRTDLPAADRVQLGAPLQINLFGHVTARDCANGRLTVVDESPARNSFVLRISETSEIVTADESADVPCDQIGLNDRIAVVEGVIDRDAGVIDTIRLRVAPADTKPPAVVRVRRGGIVLRTVCGRGLVYFQDTVPDDLVPVHVGAQTTLTCGVNATPCTCTDIAFGDMIDVVGTRRTDAARIIEGSRVHVTPNVATTFVTTVRGDVQSIDCTRQTLQAVVTEVSGDVVRPRETDLQLSEDTTYRCFGTIPCACADVQPRDRVQVEALVHVDQSRAPEAITVAVLSAADLRFLGVIDTVDCTAHQLIVRPSAETTTLVELELTRATEIQLLDGTSIMCDTLDTGARVGIRAHVEAGDVNKPRRTVADLVRLQRQRR